MFKKHKKTFGFSDKQIQEFNAVEILIELMPFSIDVELKFKDNRSLNGPLKETCLLIKKEDVLRSYGVALPGDWYTLGIIDRLSQKDCLEDVSSTTNSNINPFGFMAETIGSVIKEMYGRTNLSVTPILIFREITAE